MKIICQQAALSQGLAAVSRAVSSRSTLPILENILLTTDDGKLKLSATNLELGISYWLDAKPGPDAELQVLEGGAVTVPAKLLAKFVSELPSAPVELTVPEGTNTLSVRCARNSANIKGMDATEFPLLPGAQGEAPTVLLDARDLKAMINQVDFAAADDDTRPVFMGVLVQVKEERVTFAAADSFRLAVRSLPLPGATQVFADILVPAKTLTELANVLPHEGAVQMSVTPNGSQVLFHTDQLDLVSRLIDGTFPNYRQIIPQEAATRVTVGTKEFAAACKPALLFAGGTASMRLTVHSDEQAGAGAGVLTTEATDEDLGDARSDLDATIDGPDLSIIFNVKYLSQVLAELDSPEVTVELNAASKPGVIRPVGDIDYTYVVMPMHVNR